MCFVERSIVNKEEKKLDYTLKMHRIERDRIVFSMMMRHCTKSSEKRLIYKDNIKQVSHAFCITHDGVVRRNFEISSL